MIPKYMHELTWHVYKHKGNLNIGISFYEFSLRLVTGELY